MLSLATLHSQRTLDKQKKKAEDVCYDLDFALLTVKGFHEMDGFQKIKRQIAASIMAIEAMEQQQDQQDQQRRQKQQPPPPPRHAAASTPLPAPPPAPARTSAPTAVAPSSSPVSD
jgi:hypothetical protein